MVPVNWVDKMNEFRKILKPFRNSLSSENAEFDRDRDRSSWIARAVNTDCIVGQEIGHFPIGMQKILR